MTCILCNGPLDLFDLDTEGWGGMPAHTVCATAARKSVGDMLDDAKRMIEAEHDPRRHRRHAAA